MQTNEDKKRIKRQKLQSDDIIQKLHDRMYSREKKGFLPWRPRRNVHQEAQLVGDDWNISDGDDKEISYTPKVKKISDFAKIFMLISVFVFITASFIAFKYISDSKYALSADGVNISIEGASSIASGDVLELQLLVTNRYDIPLELAELVVTYPKGSVSPADFKTPLLSERIPLGLIDARSARRGAIRVVVFGNTGDVQEINVELQYRMQRGSAIYAQNAKHSVLINTDALSTTIEANKETVSGQQVPVSVKIKSQSSTLLSGVYVDISLPFGIDIADSAPVFDVSGDKYYRWILGDLRPGEERVVHFSVTARGQSGDVKIIRAKAGLGAFKDLENLNEEGTVLSKIEHEINVQRPFLDVKLTSGGADLDEFVANSGTTFNVAVSWENNLKVPITDATIAITLDGTALNKAGVDAGQHGFYRSVDSLLFWDPKTSGGVLKTLPPGERGVFNFEITPLTKEFLQRLKEPFLTFTVHSAGNRLNEQGVPEVLKAKYVKTVKIGTDVTFDAMALYRNNPFGSKGPIPPKAEYETVYAVVWEISNTTSDLEEVMVTAQLPPYVRWIGLVLPATERVVYNREKNTVTWYVGSVKAGSGISLVPKSVTFAIGLVPSVSQIGTSPTLVEQQVLEAVDTYTGQELRVTADDIDTSNNMLLEDESYGGQVVR